MYLDKRICSLLIQYIFFFVYRYARIINYIKQYIFRSLYRCGGTMFLTRRCFLFVFYWGFLCRHNSSFTA